MHPLEFGCARLLIGVVVDPSIVDECVAAAEVRGDPVRGGADTLLTVDVELESLQRGVRQSPNRLFAAAQVTRPEHYREAIFSKLAADLEADPAVAASHHRHRRIHARHVGGCITRMVFPDGSRNDESIP